MSNLKWFEFKSFTYNVEKQVQSVVANKGYTHAWGVPFLGTREENAGYTSHTLKGIDTTVEIEFYSNGSALMN